ncbi:MAG: valine--tRNA ligase [Candidatus Saccharimonadales bacterium]
MKLAKTYEPEQYESSIYDLWEQRGAFKPNDAKETFSIALPPPNANADLHIGHTLMFAVQDVMIRYQRMQGKSVLWVPGADHAGFETQVVFEKHLAKEGKSRFDFTREELFTQIWDFVANNRENFESQFRALGASVDWERFTFTLDDRVVTTAYDTFKKMWDDGLIYRGERLVNYCTVHRTGFADIEVQYEEKESPLYYLKYGPFELATTRPETKFGDTAVAVHPDDERYKEYVGKVLQVEGLNGPFEIRVVADEMVDRNFGTGVVKITPAHDFNDFEVAQRHNLEAVRVINHDGTLNHRAGKYEGLPVAEARKKVAEDLDKMGLLVKVDNHYKNRVGICYKCGTVIEPMLMEQWFINMEKLAQPAIEALTKKQITFYPDSKREQVIEYLKNVRDWNVSRQIAWGIPIPAFQNVDDSDDWIFNTSVDQEIIEVDGKTYRRDPDVFDTWFSSGHWPLVTMGYPDSDDFKKYYPNSVMETGQDILYQWVARMICIGLYVTGEIPFKIVYLHGMVRSEDGRKMSKSLGNVINPKEVLESSGADALRMGMLAGRSAGYSAAYAPGKITAGRNFCNKLWNIARYCETVLGDDFSRENTHVTSLADHWITGKAAEATTEIAQLIEDYRFSEAYDRLYHFVWDELADWYIEASKVAPNKQLLAQLLETILKLAHPFAPFVTETIWQTLSWTGDTLLITQAWPTLPSFDQKRAKEFEELQKIVSEIRYITTALDVKGAGFYFTKNQFLAENAELIKRLSKTHSAKEVTDGHGMHLTSTKLDCWLDIDLATAQRYVTKLKVTKLEKEAVIERLEARLNNKSYTDKAPASVVQQTKDQLHDEQILLDKIEKEIATFSAAS